MTAIIFKLIIAYLLPGAVGFLLIHLFDKKRELATALKIFAGLLVGMGIFTLQAFVAGILGAGLSLAIFLIILGIDFSVLLGLKYLFYSSRREASKDEASGEEANFKNNWLVITLLLIAIKIIASFWQVAHVPTFEFDAWNNWNLRAKVIFTEGEIPLDKDQPFYLGGGISSYPLNDGLWRVWIASLIGEWNEQAVNTSSVFHYIFLLGLFFSFLPKNFSRSVKFALVYLLGSLPFLYFHSWIPYADLAFASYLFLSTVSLFWFLVSSRQPFLYLSAIGLALAIWTKNEGFTVLAPVIFILGIWFLLGKIWSMKDLLRYWFAAFIISLPWLAFRTINRLDVLSGDSSSFDVVYNSQFLREWFYSVFMRSHFNFLWLFLFLLILFKIKKIWPRKPILSLTFIVVILFVFYNGIILFTDKALDLSALVRVNLQIAPLAVFLASLLTALFVFGRPDISEPSPSPSVQSKISER